MQLLSVTYSKHPVSTKKHYHDCHQMLYVCRGKIAVTINGQEYTAKEGDLIFLSRFEEHSIRLIESEYERYALRILLTRSSSENEFLSSVLVNRTEGFSHILPLQELRPVAEALFQKMAEEYQAKPPMYEEMLSLSLRAFLVQLYRYRPELFLPANNEIAETVYHIQNELEKNFQDHFSLAELAAKYHLSISRLSHLFKSVTGYAPIEYLTACRLSAAKNYLGTTDLPIKDIIELCGFGDQSNFSRLFREKTGKTPTEFRKQYS